MSINASVKGLRHSSKHGADVVFAACLRGMFRFVVVCGRLWENTKKVFWSLESAKSRFPNNVVPKYFCHSQLFKIQSQRRLWSRGSGTAGGRTSAGGETSDDSELRRRQWHEKDRNRRMYLGKCINLCLNKAACVFCICSVTLTSNVYAWSLAGRYYSKRFDDSGWGLLFDKEGARCCGQLVGVLRLDTRYKCIKSVMGWLVW